MADVVKEKKLSNISKNFGRFFKEVRNELKKVIWPNREQLTNNTSTVLLSCLVVGIIIWVTDAILDRLLKLFFT